MKTGHRHAGVRSIDYFAYASRLNGWNAGFKVLFSCVSLIFCIAADDLWLAVFLFAAMGFLTVGMGGLPLRDYGVLLSIPAAFLLLSGLTLACNVSWTPQGDFCLSLHWFYLYINRADAWEALRLLVKAFGAVSAMYFMTLTTPACEIVGVLRKIHTPKLVIELMYLIYRFIFILLDVQGRMRAAAESRLGYRDLRTSLRSFGGIAGNLLVLSMRKANTYYDAMVSRCYTGEMRFLEPEKPVTVRQWLCAGLVWMIGLAIRWLL